MKKKKFSSVSLTCIKLYVFILQKYSDIRSFNLAFIPETIPEQWIHPLIPLFSVSVYPALMVGRRCAPWTRIPEQRRLINMNFDSSKVVNALLNGHTFLHRLYEPNSCSELTVVKRTCEISEPPVSAGVCWPNRKQGQWQSLICNRRTVSIRVGG